MNNFIEIPLGRAKNLKGLKFGYLTPLYRIKNTKNDILDRYFYTKSKEVVFISPVGNNIMELLSSCDFDGDQLLLTDNEILIKCAKRLLEYINVDNKKIFGGQVVKRSKTLGGDYTYEVVDYKRLYQSKISCSESKITSSNFLKKLLKRMIKVRGDEGDFNDIDTSDIESMESLFQFNKTFNGDITGWNVSSVISMDNMFLGATSFNQPIGDWKFLNVIFMNRMFYNATSFKQDLSKWDLKGKDKIEIFYGCPIKKEYKPKMK